jgi:DNA polymerase III sliding clamp (beta) subunit (PCNA family)
MLQLPVNLSELARLASADAARYAAANVLLSERPDGYQLEATDGKRLGLVTGPGHEAEVPPALAGAPGGAAEALIPAREFAAVLKAGRKGRGPVSAVLGEALTTFLAGNSLTGVENGVGRWPAVDQVLPEAEPAAEFVVDARLFAELLAVAAAFADEPHHNVRIRYWHPDKPVAVTAANAEGQSFFGLQMPVCGSKPEPTQRDPAPKPRNRRAPHGDRTAEELKAEEGSEASGAGEPGPNGDGR